MFCRFLRFNKFNNITAQFANLHIHKASSGPISVPLVDTISSAYNPWLWKQNENINLPKHNNISLNFELPNGLKTILPVIDPIQHEDVEAPAFDNSVEKEAITMIVIRRKKMKKHKLKKLRKRMKFEWAKKRQRRELKKEKEFQAILIQQYTKAEAFSAEEYVTEKINKYNKLMSTATESPKMLTNTDRNT